MPAVMAMARGTPLVGAGSTPPRPSGRPKAAPATNSSTAAAAAMATHLNQEPRSAAPGSPRRAARLAAADMPAVRPLRPAAMTVGRGVGEVPDEPALTGAATGGDGGRAVW